MVETTEALLDQAVRTSGHPGHFGLQLQISGIYAQSPQGRSSLYPRI